MFKIIKKSKISKARLGVIETLHGKIESPFFMPDATFGQVRNLSSQDLINLGLECFVVNTLHLILRPGIKLIKKFGGLHDYINWQGPILSDSGGYQVYSLIHRSTSQNKSSVTDQGAIFASPLNGAQIKLSPEQSIKAQFDLGVDMMVCLDDCPPNDYNNAKLEIAVTRTINWAKRCSLEYNKQIKKRGLAGKRPFLFAVIQGGSNLILRELCAKELFKIGFDGFGFGARHVDSEGNFLTSTLEQTAGYIPENKLRFGLGIGLPLDIIKSVKMGWDMFDCVIPTREGRHGRLFFKKEITNKKFSLSNSNANEIYTAANITNAKFIKDFSPINENSKLPQLQKYSKAYLNYLFKIKEPLALRLASLNNLEFYIELLSEIRGLINRDMF